MKKWSLILLAVFCIIFVVTACEPREINIYGSPEDTYKICVYEKKLFGGYEYYGIDIEAHMNTMLNQGWKIEGQETKTGYDAGTGVVSALLFGPFGLAIGAQDQITITYYRD